MAIRRAAERGESGHPSAGVAPSPETELRGSDACGRPAAGKSGLELPPGSQTPRKRQIGSNRAGGGVPPPARPPAWPARGQPTRHVGRCKPNSAALLGADWIRWAGGGGRRRRDSRAARRGLSSLATWAAANRTQSSFLVQIRSDGQVGGTHPSLTAGAGPLRAGSLPARSHSNPPARALSHTSLRRPPAYRIWHAELQCGGRGALAPASAENRREIALNRFRRVFGPMSAHFTYPADSETRAEPHPNREDFRRLLAIQGKHV